jgi:hypothetical protein
MEEEAQRIIIFSKYISQFGWNQGGVVRGSAFCSYKEMAFQINLSFSSNRCQTFSITYFTNFQKKQGRKS